LHKNYVVLEVYIYSINELLYSIMTIEHYNLRSYTPKGYPVRHKRKEPFNPIIRVPDDYAKRTRRIRMLDLDLDRFVLRESDYWDLVIGAYSSNVHWSTKLEGNPVSEDEVKRITIETFRGRRVEKPVGPRQEIINHLTRLMFPDKYALPWTHDHILKLHKYLMKGTGGSAKSGVYRNEHSAVKDSSGMEILIPAPPERIAEEMGFLLDWMNGSALACDSVVAATVFFHEFESIHPFEDGNGRTGRCLFHLFLQNWDLQNSHLCKIEFELLNDAETYYQLLAYADDTGSYAPLIDLVSSAILRSYEKAHETLSKKDLLSSELDEGSKRLLKMAKEHGQWFSVAEAERWASSVGSQTIRNKLNNLGAIGALDKQGRTRSCRFRIKDPLEQARQRLEPRHVVSKSQQPKSGPSDSP